MTTAKGRAHRRAIGTLLVAGTAALAGCGGGDDIGEFAGVWLIDLSTDTSRLVCAPPDPLDQLFQIWEVLDLAPGVRSDLSETRGPCHLGYDVQGKRAVMPAMDPYAAEGIAPSCAYFLAADLLLEIQPMSDWALNLLQPEPNRAPRAQLVGSARALFYLVDGVGARTFIDPPCMYTSSTTYYKFASP